MKIKLYSILLSMFFITSCHSQNSNESSESKAEKNIKQPQESKNYKEYPMKEWGGTQPQLTLRENGNARLVVEVPPLEDGDGNELFDDEDFPEGLEFEKLIAEYIGTEVIRDDREVFIIENATDEQCLKVVEFFENYWSLRKEEYKSKYSE